jgi:cysteine synthase
MLHLPQILQIEIVHDFLRCLFIQVGISSGSAAVAAMKHCKKNLKIPEKLIADIFSFIFQSFSVG